MDPQARPHPDRIERSFAGHMPSSLLRRALVDRRWHPVGPWRSSDDPCDPLPAELRAWPARWRYRVAALEATGLSRVAATGVVRREVAEHALHAA